ncbi:hypothetical protein ABGB16_02550 [Micromonospora sp. B11E3]|uniref:hypothetical protein n=1 Tax=Micromonospora sp. B11E3 TaxID=3153562 RepID=UPI00325D61DD
MSKPGEKVAQQAEERLNRVAESVREKFDEITERRFNDKMSDSRFAEKIKNGLFAGQADHGVDKGRIDARRRQEEARRGGSPA